MTEQTESFYDRNGNVISVGDLVRYVWDRDVVGMVTGLTPFFDQGSIDVMCDNKYAITHIVCMPGRMTSQIEVVL